LASTSRLRSAQATPSIPPAEAGDGELPRAALRAGQRSRGRSHSAAASTCACRVTSRSAAAADLPPARGAWEHRPAAASLSPCARCTLPLLSTSSADRTCLRRTSKELDVKSQAEERPEERVSRDWRTHGPYRRRVRREELCRRRPPSAARASQHRLGLSVCSGAAEKYTAAQARQRQTAEAGTLLGEEKRRRRRRRRARMRMRGAAAAHAAGLHAAHLPGALRPSDPRRRGTQAPLRCSSLSLLFLHPLCLSHLPLSSSASLSSWCTAPSSPAPSQASPRP
jgi:hypothetical protein